MTEPKVSERMLNLVTDFGADCINYGCNQLRPMVGYPLIENVQHRAKELALYSAIAEIEQRAETAEKERDLLLLEPSNRLDGYRELADKCATLAAKCDRWKEAAVSAEHIFLGYEALEEADLDTEGAVDIAERLVTQAIERNNAAKKALGDEWNEAVKEEE